MQDGTLVLADSLTAVRETGVAPMLAAAPATAAAPAVHNVAVVRVQWAGTPATTTAVQAGDVMNGAGGLPDSSSLTAYYHEQTYGQLAFHATIFPQNGVALTLPGAPGEACAGGQSSDAALYTWLSQARAQLPRVRDVVPAHRARLPGARRRAG